MKRMKTIGLLLLLLLLLSACSGDPPVGKKLVTDPNDYMHVNAYVRAQLLEFQITRFRSRFRRTRMCWNTVTHTVAVF